MEFCQPGKWGPWDWYQNIMEKKNKTIIAISNWQTSFHHLVTAVLYRKKITQSKTKPKFTWFAICSWRRISRPQNLFWATCPDSGILNAKPWNSRKKCWVGFRIHLMSGLGIFRVTLKILTSRWGTDLRVHSHLWFTKLLRLCELIVEQECIPVGCVPSAAVAVFFGGGEVSAGGVYPGVSAQLGGVCPPLDRMTDRCKNITLPQLRCRR